MDNCFSLKEQTNEVEPSLSSVSNTNADDSIFASELFAALETYLRANCDKIKSNAAKKKAEQEAKTQHENTKP